MKSLTISLAAAASGLLMTAASAAPLSVGASDAAAAVARNSDLQQDRMVCNEAGRCWRERGARRVIIHERDSYGPRARYERRGYSARDYAALAGAATRPPAVRLVIGTHRPYATYF